MYIGASKLGCRLRCQARLMKNDSHLGMFNVKSSTHRRVCFIYLHLKYTRRGPQSNPRPSP